SCAAEPSNTEGKSSGTAIMAAYPRSLVLGIFLQVLLHELLVGADLGLIAIRVDEAVRVVGIAGLVLLMQVELGRVGSDPNVGLQLLLLRQRRQVGVGNVRESRHAAHLDP